MSKHEWAMLLQCAIRVQAVLVTVPSVVNFAFHFLPLIDNSHNGALYTIHFLLLIFISLLIDLGTLCLLWIVSPYFTQWLVFNPHERKSVTPLFNWQTAFIAIIGIYQLWIVVCFSERTWISFAYLYYYSGLSKTIIKSYFCSILVSRIFFGAFFVVSCHRIAGWIEEIGKARKLPMIEDQK